MAHLPRAEIARKFYRRALAVLDGELLRRPDEVRCPLGRRERRPAAHRSAGEFYADLGDPQHAFPAVHVAGTSGKGSTAWEIAHRLRAAGLRVGLHLSPYLQTATEKIWIDGRYLDAAAFARITDRVAAVACRRRTAEEPATVHGMASAAVAFEAFRQAGVDLAVVEASCGGRWDVTAHLRTAVAVVTSVGPDHLDVLGPRLVDVAHHKAGILRRGAAAVSGVAGPGRRVVRAEAESLGVDLVELAPSPNPFPHRNRALAAAALRALGLPDGGPGPAAGPLPGRLEPMPGPRAVLLDGAHNPQKMAALLHALPPLPRPLWAVVGLLADRDPERLLEPLARRVDGVVFTPVPVRGKSCLPPETLLRRCGPRFPRALAAPTPHAALRLALDAAGPHGAVLATGSLYLVGTLRNRWYPPARILAQGTSFPERT